LKSFSGAAFAELPTMNTFATREIGSAATMNAVPKPMTAQKLVSMLEEMMDVKIQQYAETTMRPTPEVARILQEKRETDRRRLEQIRTELVRFLET
jgi:hypothetical protein